MSFLLHEIFGPKDHNWKKFLLQLLQLPLLKAKKVFGQLKESGVNKLSLLHKDLETKERVEIVEKFRKTLDDTLAATV